MKPGIFTALALAAATLGLGACGSSPAPAEAAKPADTLSVANGRLVLAPVKGNPAAAYFDITNKGSKDWLIHSASLAGAQSTMLHTVGGPGNGGGMGEMLQIPVKAGETVKFEPGALHVMVMDPPADLAPGGKSELTLRFPGGDSISFPVEVKAAGDER
jgi:copper(I)-binding protein